MTFLCIILPQKTWCRRPAGQMFQSVILALLRKDTTTHRWFPFSPHHYVWLELAAAAAALHQLCSEAVSSCLFICMLMLFLLKERAGPMCWERRFTEHGGNNHDSADRLHSDFKQQPPVWKLGSRTQPFAVNSSLHGRLHALDSTSPSSFTPVITTAIWRGLTDQAAVFLTG